MPGQEEWSRGLCPASCRSYVRHPVQWSPPAARCLCDRNSAASSRSRRPPITRHRGLSLRSSPSALPAIVREGRVPPLNLSRAPAGPSAWAAFPSPVSTGLAHSEHKPGLYSPAPDRVSQGACVVADLHLPTPDTLRKIRLPQPALLTPGLLLSPFSTLGRC